jgi:hypothetical protein
LTVIAWAALAAACATALLIVYDLYGRGYRQTMAVMEAVWPITALYLGPLAWFAYRRWGRLNNREYQRQTGDEPDYGEPVSVGVGVSHCDAGCTLGDIIGAWLVFVVSWQLLGLALRRSTSPVSCWPARLASPFQYFSIAPMRDLGLRDATTSPTCTPARARSAPPANTPTPAS